MRRSVLLFAIQGENMIGKQSGWPHGPPMPIPEHQNKAKWAALLEMEANWESGYRSPLPDNSDDVIRTLKMFYAVEDSSHSTEEIFWVTAILDIDAYEVKMPAVNIQRGKRVASLAEHSCLPNSFKTTSRVMSETGPMTKPEPEGQGETDQVDGRCGCGCE